MVESKRTESGGVKAAAADLRAAIHELAERTLTVQPDATQLREAASQVRSAAKALHGDSFPAWWDGPSVAHDDPSLRQYRHRSVFQGELHPFSPSLRWGDHAEIDGMPGYSFEVTLPQLFGGPPRAVHGGYLAGLFDELLGAVQSLAEGGGGYTGRLTVRYRSLTPIDELLTFRGWVTAETSRRIETRATCHAGERLCAEAEGLFVRPAAG